MNESLLSKLKRIKLGDIGHFFLFILAIIPAVIVKRRRPHLWLLCEYRMEAQDNAYALFSYLRDKQPEIDAVYAIASDSPDQSKVASIGSTVPYGSFTHWIYYLAAEVNISSQKGGKPNAAVCYLFEVVLGWLKNKRVFLQHGVTKDDLPFLHYDKAKLSMFCCAALPEYEFIRDTFGYPDGVVQYLGFCRFDKLHQTKPDSRLILILPTWRMWLERECKTPKDFQQSDYFLAWNALLNSKEFDLLLSKYGKHVVYCTHRNMSQFETSFSTKSNLISLCKWDELSIPPLLKQASVLITDYSSVYMDFAYMKKPVVYYQFDKTAYRKGHLPTGYFDYARDGFGPVSSCVSDLLADLEHILHNDCQMDSVYKARADSFFSLYDANNSERTYYAIKEMIELREKDVFKG